MIRHYRRTENYKAIKICRKFEGKGWVVSGKNSMLKKIEEKDSIGSKAGSGNQDQRESRQTLKKWKSGY